MATDATGAPTSKFNLPKFNTAVDAPSGLGGNAQMDAIDAALANLGISTIVANDVPVWDSVAGKWKKTTGTPSSTTFLRGDGSWATPTTPALYRKTTAKVVSNTVTETDLLNSEITVAGGVMGTTGVLRLTALGDWINNTGATQSLPRFRVKLGSTVLLATSGVAAAWATNPGRWGWRIQVEIANLGAANNQWVNLLGNAAGSMVNSVIGPFVTGEGFDGTTTGDEWQAIGGASGAVDTTTAQILALTTINPVASASLDVTLKAAFVEIL